MYTSFLYFLNHESMITFIGDLENAETKLANIFLFNEIWISAVVNKDIFSSKLFTLELFL